MVLIDFETRSRVDLKKSGAWRYAEDASTEVMCMAYTANDEVRLWLPGDKPFVLAGDVIAHNAFFERSIYENIMVKRHGFQPIAPGNWKCSAAKAAAHAVPRGLADACGALALDMQKDKEGRAIMLKLCKPRTPTKNNSAEWNEDEADLLKLYQYCMQDIRSQVGLYNRLPELPTSEQEVWHLDQKINHRGVKVDMETVNAAICLIDKYYAELTAELQELTQSAVGSADERGKMQAWLACQGLEMETLTKGSVADALKNPQSAVVRRVLEIRQQLAKTSTAKYYAIRDAVCKDGRLRDLLMYHGASTGRWAGRGPQPQNLPRNTMIKDVDTAIKLVRTRDLDTFRFCYDDPMLILSQLIRSMFVASEGKILVGGDYAAIEVRVLFWLAGEKAGLEMFKKGEDLYVDLAKKIYQTKTATKEQRELGKRGILGCGYGMGAAKFKATCEIFGSIIDEDFSKKVIEIYRGSYNSVVRFWYEQETAAIQAVKKASVVTAGKIKWVTKNGFLYGRLPSGRCLAYCHPKIDVVTTPWGAKKEALTFMATNPVSKKWERQSTYGGAIAENLTQAVARDLMADAMVRAEKLGMEVLMSVHDELIVEFLHFSDDQSELKEVMEYLPKWADGLPIKVETWSGQRYAK